MNICSIIYTVCETQHKMKSWQQASFMALATIRMNTVTASFF